MRNDDSALLFLLPPPKHPATAALDDKALRYATPFPQIKEQLLLESIPAPRSRGLGRLRPQDGSTPSHLRADPKANVAVNP
jgi:hypothetical protein